MKTTAVKKERKINDYYLNLANNENNSIIKYLSTCNNKNKEI